MASTYQITCKQDCLDPVYLTVMQHPVTLPCSHKLDAATIAQLIQASQVERKCPLCRFKYNITQIMDQEHDEWKEDKDCAKKIDKYVQTHRDEFMQEQLEGQPLIRPSQIMQRNAAETPHIEDLINIYIQWIQRGADATVLDVIGHTPEQSLRSAIESVNQAIASQNLSPLSSLRTWLSVNKYCLFMSIGTALAALALRYYRFV